MKNNIKLNICLAFFTVIGFAMSANTINKNTNDSLQSIEIKGKISNLLSESRTYTVELISNSIVINSKVISDEQTFCFTILNNRNYDIKISKEGYGTKSVSVNTYKSNNTYSAGLLRYEFTVDLESVSNTPVKKNTANIKMVPFNWSRKYSKKVIELP